MDEVTKKSKLFQKSSRVEVGRRVKEVATLLLDGQTRHEILQFASKWGLSERQVDDYIARAQELVSDINREDLQNTLAIVKHNYWQLYRSARRNKDILLSVNILDKLAKLMGLYN